VAFLRDSNLTAVRTFAILELGELELEGSYRLVGRGEGAWAWLGADSISSQVRNRSYRLVGRGEGAWAWLGADSISSQV
jgi:hypothetical protein